MTLLRNPDANSSDVVDNSMILLTDISETTVLNSNASLFPLDINVALFSLDVTLQ